MTIQPSPLADARGCGLPLAAAVCAHIHLAHDRCRRVEHAAESCDDPSNCPPQTRDRFEQAIQLRYPPVPDRPSCAAPTAPEKSEPPHTAAPGTISAAQPAACPVRTPTSAARLGDVDPVRPEEAQIVTRTTTRFVTPGMPGRFVDLIV